MRTKNGRILLRNTGLPTARLSGTSQHVPDTVDEIVKAAWFLHKYLCRNMQRERSFLAFDVAISSVCQIFHCARFLVAFIIYSCSLSVDIRVRTVA